MIKSIFGKSSQNTNVSKYPKRAALVQPNNENANILKTPPPKNSNKMQVEKPIPLVPVRKPLQPIENKNQLAKTKNQGLFMANKENEMPHRNTRNQKPLVIPAKVSVLEIEQESNMVIESTHSDELVAKEDLTYFEKVVEPIEIEIGPTLDLDLLLEIDYGKIIEDDIFNHQPDFSNCLQHTYIKENLRAKMIDWVIEVLGNYHESTSHHTYFLSIAILDLFFKNSQRKLKDSDVHLSGIAAMFLASKYEDVYHIPLKDFVERVGHGKFSADDVKAREWEILKALDYNLSFPTTLHYLERLIYKNFHEDGCNMLKNIKDAAIHILKMCLYEYKFLNYTPLTVALAVLCYCIKCYFYSLSEENSKNGNPIDLTEQENALIQSILLCCSQVNVQHVRDCMHEVNDLTYSFTTKFPDLVNLKRFSELNSKTR